MTMHRFSLLLLPLLVASLWYFWPWSAPSKPAAAVASAATAVAPGAVSGAAGSGFFEQALPGTPSGDEALAAVGRQNAADQQYAQLLAPQLQQQIEQRERLLAKARQDRNIRAEDIARVEAELVEMRAFHQQMAQRGMQR